MGRSHRRRTRALPGPAVRHAGYGCQCPGTSRLVAQRWPRDDGISRPGENPVSIPDASRTLFSAQPCGLAAKLEPLTPSLPWKMGVEWGYLSRNPARPEAVKGPTAIPTDVRPSQVMGRGLRRRQPSRPTPPPKPQSSQTSTGARNGAKRIRTADLLGAIQALSQLSYSPANAQYIERQAGPEPGRTGIPSCLRAELVTRPRCHHEGGQQ